MGSITDKTTTSTDGRHDRSDDRRSDPGIRWRRHLVGVLIAAVALSACAGGDDDASADEPASEDVAGDFDSALGQLPPNVPLQ